MLDLGRTAFFLTFFASFFHFFFAIIAYSFVHYVFSLRHV
jgi:hypothetical protein